jgi:cytolysin-activating lysine-acyltransferase
MTLALSTKLEAVLPPQLQNLNNRNDLEISNKTLTKEPIQMMSSVIWLMLHSPLHRQYSIALFEKQIMPSLMHNQFRYYEQGGRPIGFVNWAWLTDEVEERFQTTKYLLSPSEWVAGNKLWFPEFIAPFGQARLIIKDLRTNFFPNHEAKALRVKYDGTVKGIIRHRGKFFQK